MIFMRESDGVHFLWNGEHPIRISPIEIKDYAAARDPDHSPKWHHDHGQLPDIEWAILDLAMKSRVRGFSISEYGRYQVVARGEFKGL